MSYSFLSICTKVYVASNETKSDSRQTGTLMRPVVYETYSIQVWDRSDLQLILEEQTTP